MSWRNFLANIIRPVAAIFLLASSLALPPSAQAQSPILRFFHLTTANGLSHNIVYAIVQDHQGFLWFGTQDGLNRYDGYTFTVFRHLRSDPSSLVHNTVQALAVDSTGTLWVGTVGGLDRYDRDTHHFVHYPEVAESVTIIYEDRVGTLWVGTAGSGLFRYDPAGDRFVPCGGEGKPRLYGGDNILALYQDADGTLWVGTEYGGLWGDHEGRPYGYRHDPADPHSLPHDRVTAITQDHAGTLWVGTGVLHEPTVGGLAALDPATGRFALYRQGLDHAHITAVLEDGTGTLWVGTENGLAILDRATGQFTVCHHDPLDPYSLGNDRIYTLYEDRTGILWIATDDGVSRYIREKNRFALYRHDPLDPNSLSAPRVGAVLVTTKDTKDAENLCVPSCPSWLWVGLHAGGLDRIDLVTGTVTHYRHDPNDPHSLSHDHVTALCQDYTGAIWVGTDAGLDRLDSATNRFTHYVYDPTDPHSLGPGAVKVIYEDRSHALWIGTEEPGILSRRDPATGRFTVYRYDPALPDGFPNTYGIRAILQDHAGTLWLGTYSGLVRLGPGTGTAALRPSFTQYRHDPDDPHSLSDDFVWALYEDRDGTLWVGTQSGLNHLSK
ncbi:MAG: two-component regulator propeller domain-containing protein [Anaerolineae bacterium]|nr:two-component regulator propeller domain-containing protein [Anaerolineae bacterium]